MMSKTGNLCKYTLLVTGAYGFLGSHLVRSLLERGATVIGISRHRNVPDRLSKFANHHAFRMVFGEFSDSTHDKLSQILLENKKKLALFHMAGLAHAEECRKYPEKAFSSNVNLTFQVLEFCRNHNVPQFVYPSTGLVYGDLLGRPAHEGDPTNPQNIYTATKLSAESVIGGYAESYRLSCIVARLGNVYGSGSNSDTVVSIIAKQVRDKGNIRLQDLTTVRDFIYIQDVVDGLLTLLTALEGPGCHIVNLSTGIGSSIRQLAEIACRIASIPEENIESRAKAGQAGPVRSSLVLDNSLLHKTTGWKPNVGLTEGLSIISRGANQSNAS